MNYEEEYYSLHQKYESLLQEKEQLQQENDELKEQFKKVNTKLDDIEIREGRLIGSIKKTQSTVSQLRQFIQAMERDGNE